MKCIKNNSLYLVFAIALVSILGSLYFSEIRNFPPCILCWYQRIFMYPLVIISLIGILTKDVRARLYVLVLSIIGALIALYHNLLYHNILPESAAPCLNGVSCTTEYISWLGFITIPLLSLVAFIVIIILMLNKKENE